jgi:phytol kinase
MSEERALEVRRQLFHLVLGSIITIAVWLLKPAYGNIILAPLAFAIMLLLALPRLAPNLVVSNHLLTRFERKKDVKTFPYKGAIFYGIGIFFPIYLLQINIACIVILILSIGDAMSTLVGKFYGKIRIGSKSIEGTIAFIVFSLIGNIVFLIIAGRADLLGITVIMTTAGALLELQPVIDDNLAVPIGLTMLARLAGL